MTSKLLNMAALLLVAVTAASTSTGCSSGRGELPRHDIQGQVTHGNQPVPVGQIIFTPDAQAGNSGPASVATIQNGRYQTQPGKGIVGGAYRVRVHGYGGRPIEIPGEGTSSQGNPLFPPYELEVTLPAEASEMDFDVPR